MALSETDNSDCNSDSSVDGVGNINKERKEKHLTKIVVRRLPPSMNKETFLNQVSPLSDYDYMYFVRADMSLGEYAFSRAYINFKNSTDIFIFKEKFDNYVFLDSKGNEYAAVVEFAPFSRIPKKRNKRPDPKNGTIESDPIYTEFLESLNEVITENEEKPEYCFQPSVDDKKEIINTPLLDYIKQRRIDRQKMKEEKREERKRKEIEKKRVKDDDRKGREKSYSSSIRKIPYKSYDESKSDTNIKLKDRKSDDYKNKTGKSSSFREREYPDKKTTYISGKSIHSTIDRKPLPKMRQRSTSYQEKESRRSDYKTTRREDSTTKYKKDERDEKVLEKKVKKYSERREERKNEIKKTETKPDTEPSNSKETKDESKDESKFKEDKGDISKSTVKDNKESDKKSDSEKTPEPRENTKSRDSESRESTRSRENNSRERTRSRENDPRTQRRIRNKDRPAMQIYQPGMGFRSKQKYSESNQDELKNSIVNEDEQKDSL